MANDAKPKNQPRRTPADAFTRILEAYEARTGSNLCDLVVEWQLRSQEETTETSPEALFWQEASREGIRAWALQKETGNQ